MDWGNTIGTIIALLLVVIGLSATFRKRKKSSHQNMEKLFHHLQEMGIRASLLEGSLEEAKIGVSRASGQKSEGIIKIEGKNIDYINVISVASQYGVRFLLDHLVKTSGGLSKTGRKKTRMVGRKSSGMWGKVVDIEWRGDDYLSQQLSLDYRLKDGLLRAELDKLKNSIWIFPEPKYECARVRISYLLPSSDLFDAIDIIARHIKSAW